MRISVITVCLNAIDVIDVSVRSVLSQSYHDLEYVVLDGGSKDGTLERLRSYGNSITRVVSELDTGPYNAMNKALRLVDGKVIIFLNAGDSFSSYDVVATVAQAFNDDPEAMLIYGDYLILFPPGGTLAIRQANQLTRWRLWLRAVCHQTIFARRELFEKVGNFDETLAICADWDWTIRTVLIEHSRTIHLPVRVCNFRMGGICSNRRALQRDKKVLHKRYYSNVERCLFSFLEIPYKVGIRIQAMDFSLPWMVRRLLRREKK